MKWHWNQKINKNIFIMFFSGDGLYRGKEWGLFLIYNNVKIEMFEEVEKALIFQKIRFYLVVRYSY